METWVYFMTFGYFNGKFNSLLVFFGVIWCIFFVLVGFTKTNSLLVFFGVIWCIFFRFGMFYQDKSGNFALIPPGKKCFQIKE
jgi:hypothetical protein